MCVAWHIRVEFTSEVTMESKSVNNLTLIFLWNRKGKRNQKLLNPHIVVIKTLENCNTKGKIISEAICLVLTSSKNEGNVCKILP